MATPYQFANRGQLLIVPVGPSIDEVPYPSQTLTKPPDYSVWVHGAVHEPGPGLDAGRMSPRLYQEVRKDLARYAPVEVTRSAFRRASHAYVGVIDSRGTPYYFALDSRGVSVREAPGDAAWKAFERLAGDELAAAVRERRAEAGREVRAMGAELAAPLVVTKGLKYGKKLDWEHNVPHSSWWRKPPRTKKTKAGDPGHESAESAEADAVDKSDVLVVVDHVIKALPRGGKEEEAKKTPSHKASKKKGGRGGKTRYSYPGEGKSGGARGSGGQVPLVVEHDDTRNADPAELANQLGVSVRTLQHVARRLGSDDFSAFMRARLKRFAAKHRLDPDYWGTLYSVLVATPGEPVAKSNDAAAWKEFGDDVNRVAAAVPEGHRERFGDRKVFIHHVHDEMKRRGLYSGDLDQFKQHVAAAHQKRYVVLSRADLVAAMDPRSVARAETKLDNARFHFVSGAQHDPAALKKLDAATAARSAPAPAASTPAAAGRVRSKPAKKAGPLYDAAHAASQEAVEATAHANKTRTPDAHLVAMAAHHQAGAAHQKASGRTSDKAALRHFEQSTSHLHASKATP